MSKVIVITGIGTGVGKSYATGWLARELAAKGNRVNTIKMIQTGNVGYSEDIEVHRAVMGVPLSEADKEMITAPIVMSYPASPHLAARIDGVDIDLGKIDRSVETLSADYDILLMEAAGGLMVPITEELLTIDYIKSKDYATALVVNGELGSINHILLSLEAIERRGITLDYMIYNPFFDRDDIICDETRAYIQKYLKAHFPDAAYLEMPAEL